MKNKYLLTSIVICFLFILGCEKESDKSVSQSDAMLDDIAASISESTTDTDNSKYLCTNSQVLEIHPGEYTELVKPTREPQNIQITSKSVTGSAPDIDGVDDEQIWQHIEPVEVLDYSSQRPITVKTCHDQESIYFLVKFFDLSQSDTQKTWIWDKTENIYVQGNDREDCLVLKWKINGGNMSFHPDKAEPHTADIWFWKARRTNPSGYFDDKIQVISQEESEKAFAFPSDKFGTLYLSRSGDEGKSAYEDKMFFENIGPAVHKFYPVVPLGSRADIKGKGQWNDNSWTIEFTRKLNTAHKDDIAISKDKECQFSIALYEMAATGIEPSWTQPLYRTGDVFDILTLVLE